MPRRDQAYSTWHRGLPYDLDFLDVDWIEVCHVCKRILAAYELCADITQIEKVTYQTRAVAAGLGVVGFAVLYEADGGTISRFRIKRITEPTTEWRWVTPVQWERQLLSLRTCHPIIALAPTSTYVPASQVTWEPDEVLDALGETS